MGEKAPRRRAPETTTPREKNCDPPRGVEHALVQRRGSVCLSRCQDFVGSARRSTDRARTRKPATTAEVDTLVQKTNRESRCWLAAVELPPEEFQGGAEERRSERAPRRRRRRAQTPPAVCYSSRTLSTSPRRRHCRIDRHHHRHQLTPSRTSTSRRQSRRRIDHHRHPNPTADRGRGDAEDSGMVGERALAQAEAARIEHRASRATHQIGGRRSLTPRRSHRARSLTNDPPIAMAARPSPITASPPRTRRRPTPRS